MRATGFRLSMMLVIFLMYLISMLIMVNMMLMISMNMLMQMTMSSTQWAAPAHLSQRPPGPSSRCAQSWVESHYDEIMKTMTTRMMIIKR